MKLYFVSFRQGMSTVTEHAHILANTKKDAVEFCDRTNRFVSAIYEVETKNIEGLPLKRVYVA